MPRNADKINICSLAALPIKSESQLCQRLLASLIKSVLFEGVCAILKALKLLCKTTIMAVAGYKVK